MAFVPGICPQCGGQLDVDNSKDAAICKFCGTPFVVEKAVNNFSIDLDNGTFKIENATINIVMGAEKKASRDRDELFAKAGEVIVEKQKGSTALLQRTFKIGIMRATKIMEQLEDAGVVGPENGTAQRKVIMNVEQYNRFLRDNNYM